MVKERKDIMEYESAPSGAIKLYNYKEPFMPAKNGGFGFQGVLLHDAEEQLIQCHVCGEWFRSLSSHIKLHGFPRTRDYKDEFGLAHDTALVCEETRNKYIVVATERAKAYKGKIPKTAGQGSRIGTKISMEKRNNRGTCPLQLLDKLESIKNELGYQPSWSKTCDTVTLNGKPFSGRGLVSSLELVFGSWDNAISQLHWTGSDKKELRRWTKESLIQIYREFVKKNKRFPSDSDYRRGVLPSPTSFNRYGVGREKVKEIIIQELIQKM